MLIPSAKGKKASDAAIEFLVRHPEVWTAWVSAGVAKKVRAAIGL